MKRVKFTGKSNDYLTHGKVYDAKDVVNQHGTLPLYGIVNDKGEQVVVASDAFVEV